MTLPRFRLHGNQQKIAVFMQNVVDHNL